MSDQTGRFRLREHTADVAVEASAPTLGATFAAVADGLAAAMCDDAPADGERFAVTVTAESAEAALFDYLDTLIYERDVRSVLPVDNEATVSADGVTPDGATGSHPDDGRVDAGDGRVDADEWTVDASARGVPLAAVTAREVKAVTYSEMRVERAADGWRAYVVFDV
ncbi:archease [Candidatus Halobonum tyrrellensis]|uniref:Archease domain-containing protein n=1 Tax=Candidatus Halobonum tyrrellensis G22 TaxID=1324957 RepID=V4HNE8_9EURY|nr:archease [Candidatus Halobonum tyrrellensis]ESP89444.1 hypothetical protein K933_03765 [Candidatus Halobonum tyrrellensis G22]